MAWGAARPIRPDDGSKTLPGKKPGNSRRHWSAVWGAEVYESFRGALLLGFRGPAADDERNRTYFVARQIICGAGDGPAILGQICKRAETFRGHVQGCRRSGFKGGRPAGFEVFCPSDCVRRDWAVRTVFARWLGPRVGVVNSTGSRGLGVLLLDRPKSHTGKPW